MSQRVLVFAGSTRSGSFNRKLAEEAARLVEQDGRAVTTVDLKDFPMPLYDGDTESAQGLPPQAKQLKRLLREHDAFVIASPEYNGSFPALLKNIVDWTSRPEPGEAPLVAYRGKLAAVISASPGAGGGKRGLRHLRELLEMIGVRVVATQLTVARAMEAFDAEGHLLRPEDREQLTAVARDLAGALQQAGASAA